MRETSSLTSDSEDTPLVNQLTVNPDEDEITYRYYAIDEKIELGEMATIFFNKFGVILFYACLIVYLCGDLTIYMAAVAKTLADVSCTYIPQNLTINDTIPDSAPCYEGSKYFNRLDAYKGFLVGSFQFLISFIS